MFNDRDKEAAGTYLFESDRPLNDYLSGPLLAQMKSSPAISDISAKVFDVVDELTAVTRRPV